MRAFRAIFLFQNGNCSLPAYFRSPAIPAWLYAADNTRVVIGCGRPLQSDFRFGILRALSPLVGRPRRNFEPGEIYLAGHSGNKNLNVYLDAEDHEYALRLLRINSRRYGVIVLAYSQAHRQAFWLLKPSTADGISNLMRDMQGGYSRYLNRKYKHRHWLAASDSGPSRAQTAGRIHRSVNYPGRYECIRVSDGLLQVITHFIEQSPLRLGISDDASVYPWSSAPARLRGRCVRDIVQLIQLSIAPDRWAAHLATELDPGFVPSVEMLLRRGRTGRNTSVPSYRNELAGPAAPTLYSG
jgi:hypothetical protein